METKFTPPPWYVLDQRASTLRSQGWTGPDHDTILISNYPPSEITPEHCDCIVARIVFDNRAEELGESNIADAHLIAAAPALYEALDTLFTDPQFQVSIGGNPNMVEALMARCNAALALARGETSHPEHCGGMETSAESGEPNQEKEA